MLTPKVTNGAPPQTHRLRKSALNNAQPHQTLEAKNQNLADAVCQKWLDLVALLVAYLAEIKAVPFADVLLGWEPRIIQFFIDNGADVITRSPFAVAFAKKIRTAPVRWIFHLHRFISNRLFNRLTAYTGVNEIF